VHERRPRPEPDAPLEAALRVDPGIGVEDPRQRLPHLALSAHRVSPLVSSDLLKDSRRWRRGRWPGRSGTST
jgi:hypothetical protein